MRIKPYPFIRDLHLYLGLFISPFVVVFSLSAIFIAHAFIPKFGPDSSKTRVVSDLSIPSNLTNLTGRSQVDALRPILESIHIPVEIGFVQYSSAVQQWTIPVTVPGRETTVTLSLPKKEATIVVREISLAGTLVTLHKSPGPHGPAIRMNWFFMKVWQWLADATVYLVLFISISGVYLWFVLRSERTVGFILIFAGAATFFGIAYAVSH